MLQRQPIAVRIAGRGNTARSHRGGRICDRDEDRVHKGGRADMRRRVLVTWVLLIALFSLWQAAESAWESTGALVLDISRSMQENDPHNTRSDGEQTFIDLLSSVEG